MADPSHFQDHNSCHRTLQLAELVQTICRFSDKRDYVNLLYLCRDTYSSILPFVWEEVDLIWVLLLIPGAKGTGREGDPDFYRSISFASDTLDLARFSIHSPFVKTVTTGAIEQVDFSNRWPDFGSQFLLPNLHRLVINQKFGFLEQHAECLQRILSPNILEVSMVDKDEQSEGNIQTQTFRSRVELGAESCSDIMGWISQSCPRIEKLRLFPPNLSGMPRREPYPAYEELVNFTTLRSCTLVVSEVHNNIFQALGQLPHLEELALVDSGRRFKIPRRIILSDSLFPRLLYLDLCRLGIGALAAICEAAPLFRRLITAKIVQTFYNPPYFADHERTTIAVQSIGPNSPHLKDLTIHPRASKGCFVITLPVVNRFKCMPLTRLDLGKVIFSPQDDGYTEAAWNYEGDELTRNNTIAVRWGTLLGAVPGLEELLLEQQEMRVEHLELCVALLPNLHLLAVHNVIFDKPSKEVNASQSIVIRNQVCAGLLHSVHETARHVYGLWPNAICEINVPEYEWMEDIFASINDALNALRSETK